MYTKKKFQNDSYQNIFLFSNFITHFYGTHNASFFLLYYYFSIYMNRGVYYMQREKNIKNKCIVFWGLFTYFLNNAYISSSLVSRIIKTIKKSFNISEKWYLPPLFLRFFFISVPVCKKKFFVTNILGRNAYFKFLQKLRGQALL